MIKNKLTYLLTESFENISSINNSNAIQQEMVNDIVGNLSHKFSSEVQQEINDELETAKSDFTDEIEKYIFEKFNIDEHYYSSNVDDMWNENKSEAIGNLSYYIRNNAPDVITYKLNNMNGRVELEIDNIAYPHFIKNIQGLVSEINGYQ